MLFLCYSLPTSQSHVIDWGWGMKKKENNQYMVDWWWEKRDKTGSNQYSTAQSLSYRSQARKAEFKPSQNKPNTASFSRCRCSWNYQKKTKITKIKEQNRNKVFKTTEVKIRAAWFKKKKLQKIVQLQATSPMNASGCSKIHISPMCSWVLATHPINKWHLSYFPVHKATTTSSLCLVKVCVFRVAVQSTLSMV